MFPNGYFAPSYFTGEYWPPLGEEVVHYIYAAASVFSSMAIGSTFNANSAAMITSVTAKKMVIAGNMALTLFAKAAKEALFSLIGKDIE